MRSKKWMFWMLAAVLAVFLVGCHRTEQPVETTEPALPQWQKMTEYPTYAEFFREDRIYALPESPCSWTVNGQSYTLAWEADGNLYVQGSALEAPVQVSADMDLESCQLLGCDGQYAYLTRQENGIVTAVLRLDLAAGVVEPVLENTALLDVYLCEGVVLYYMDCREEPSQICRMYLPEQRLDVLHTLEVSAALVQLEPPVSTLGKVIWSTVRPYMQDMLMTELVNRESIYRFGQDAVIALWEKTDSFSDPANRDALYQLSELISAKTGVDAVWSEAVSETMPWLRTEPYPAYDTLFSRDLTYAPEADSCSWIVTTEQGGIRYYLERHAELNNVRQNGANLYIRSDAWQTRELVYSGEELEDCYLLACDGRYAYFGRYAIPEDSSLYRQILQLDLTDKTVTTLVEAVGIGSVYFCGDAVLYYLRWDGAKGQICRMYLPEQKEEILCVPDTLPALLSFHKPQSTLGDITWSVWWPEYVAQAEKELENPESPYRDMHTYRQQYSQLWDGENPMQDYLYKSGIYDLCEKIAHRSDAWMDKWASFYDQYRCCLADGRISVEETDPVHPEPVLVLSQWQSLPGYALTRDISGKNMPKDGEVLVYGRGFLPGQLLLIREGVATLLLEETVLECVAGEDAVYCITADNRLLQVAYDGSVCNTLYAGGETPLAKAQYAAGFVYVARGAEILEIDLAAGQYRVLVQQPYLEILSAYADEYSRDKRLYFSGGKGRDYGFFRFDFETETLEQQGMVILE